MLFSESITHPHNKYLVRVCSSKALAAKATILSMFSGLGYFLCWAFHSYVSMGVVGVGESVLHWALCRCSMGEELCGVGTQNAGDRLPDFSLTFPISVRKP
jgi:hypothetical protein